MKRVLFGLPLAGAMMTASLAFAQTAEPTAPAPAAVQSDDDEAQDDSDASREGCVDLTEGESSETTEDMQSALDETSPADGEAAEPQETASESESETQPVTGADAGTAPGGSGSTGWTGGLGGSDIGTSQSEGLDSSPDQDHPQVASGLDPISGETAIEGPQAPPELDEDAQITPTAPDEDAAERC